MATRDAVSTIRGYFYQFDYSILQVLKLGRDTDTICIEGIEDVDINNKENTTFHQCKCYEGTKYNHSVIKDAVGWMLKHFADNRNSDYKYYIYGVYESGQEKLAQGIEVEFAKKHFFTKKHKNSPDELLHEQLSLTDDDISVFLQRLVININADSFEVQEKNVRNELRSSLNLREQEVELYYYTALSIIRHLATQKSVSDRTISRGEFIRQIRSTDNQFEMWLLHKNGSAKFAKAIKKKYFSEGLNISPYARFFIIECNQHTSIVELKTVILRISGKYSNLRQSAKPKFCPYFCFYGIDDTELVELKKCLARDDVQFVDGYDFKGADFNVNSVVKEPNKDRLISLRIIDSIDLLDKVYEALNSTIEIYQFYHSSAKYENSDYKHIKIPFENIKDIIDMV